MADIMTSNKFELISQTHPNNHWSFGEESKTTAQRKAATQNNVDVVIWRHVFLYITIELSTSENIHIVFCRIRLISWERQPVQNKSYIKRYFFQSLKWGFGLRNKIYKTTNIYYKIPGLDNLIAQHGCLIL